jgi:uncharacterized membrane protein required for colicin V production
MSLILDLMVVVVFLIFIFSSYRKGLVRSIIELVGYLASFVVSYIFSTPLGNWIFTTFLQPIISGQIKADLAKNLAGNATKQANAAIDTTGIANILNNIPNVFKNLFGSNNISTDNLQKITGNAITSGSQSATNTLLTTVIDPISRTISIGIAFLIIFALCMVAVRIIARMSGGISRIPVIGTANRLGGVVVGVVKSVIVVFIIATCIAILVPLLSLQNNHVITQANIDNSTLFKAIYYNNPLSQLLLKK